MSQFQILATVPGNQSGMGTGAFGADTLKDALEKAHNLRGQGLEVVIKGPDGGVVDEAAIDEDDL